MPCPPSTARVFLGVALAVTASVCAPSVAIAAPVGSAPSAVAPETVLAALLLNFVRFTEWPKDVPPPVAPYSIGVSGNRSLEDELLRLADRQLIRGHRLRVVRIKSADDLDGLHLAYVDSGAAAQPDALGARDVLARLRGAPVLTVSDAVDFTEIGGIVHIYREDKALRFEITPEAAREAGLVLSSRLLALARTHRSAPAPAVSSP